MFKYRLVLRSFYYPLIFFLLIRAQAIDAQTSISPWIQFGKLSNSDVYVQENTIEQIGDFLKIWVLYDYHSPKKSPYDEPYRSNSTLFQFDCQEKKSQKLNSYGYEQVMGKGKQIDLLEKNPSWIDLPTNSIGFHLIETYCSKIIGKIN
jgi:hypothetical protein